MLADFVHRLARPLAGPANDRLFTPFAPEGAPAQVLSAIYHKHADALPDEDVPPQHHHFRILADAIMGPLQGCMRKLDGMTLRRVNSAYVTCFEQHEAFAFQLSLWREESDFRQLLQGARQRVIEDLLARANEETARAAYYERWEECLAAPLPLRGERLLDQLPQMSPDDWHEIALNWDWRAGVKALNWITAQRRCDRATAVYILCAGKPGAVATHTGSLAHAGFVRTVAARLENGFYPTADLALRLPMRTRAEFVRELAVARATRESPWQLDDDLIHHPGVRDHAPRYTLVEGQVRYHYDHWLAHVAPKR